MPLPKRRITLRGKTAPPAPETEIRRLVKANLELVEPIAIAAYRKLPKGYIELADVVQAGRVGLIDAARKYRPGSTPFAWYARMRIKGAIIDSIRCEPFAGWVSNRREFPPELAVPYPHETKPGRRQLRLQKALSDAVATLSDREQKVLELRYVEGQSIQQIGESRVLNFGAGQAKKEHAGALRKLRDSLRKAA